ncbi:MAG: site-specific integrase [Bacteroidetes bacterium]|nr:site-specific integrase [Bacteroidota bacterium]
MEPNQTKDVTTAILLEKRMVRINGYYPVKLRVTYDRKQKFYTIHYHPEKVGDDFTEQQKYWIKRTDKSITLNEKEFKKVRQANPSEPYKTLAVYINAQEEQAQITKEKVKPFTFEKFEDKYFAKATTSNDIISVLQGQAKEKQSAGKISTARTYEGAMNSLKEFTGKDKLPFTSVTVKFLQEYEKWMLTPKVIKGKKISKPNSRATVGIYLRDVRAVFNMVKPTGVIYPFGKTKHGLYAIPKGRNLKKALTLADVGKIANYQPIEGSIEHRSRDLWLFSYLCNGINTKDIARLKYANIHGDKITLIRAKTAETAEEQSTIDIMITRLIGRIIDKWGVKPGTQDQYIFPILRNGMTPQDEYKAIQQAVQTINKNMVNVCSGIKIEKVTTYTARHSYATVLKRSGASTEFISESLGHRNTQTTRNYLANFEDDEKMKWAETLANFDAAEQ